MAKNPYSIPTMPAAGGTAKLAATAPMAMKAPVAPKNPVMKMPRVTRQPQRTTLPRAQQFNTGLIKKAKTGA